MAATFPGGVKSFTTKNNGDIIQPVDVNGLQDEVTAIETNLLQAMTSVTFSAGDYGATGSMTWTVAGGDITSPLAYVLRGKFLKVNLVLTGGTIGGTPAAGLVIKVPAGKASARKQAGSVRVFNNSTWSYGYVEIAATSTNMVIFKDMAQTLWTLETGVTVIQFLDVEFEVS